MRIAGVIAEYNPFHNGHAWHIAETRRLTGCDYVVACMAGHFTQRGEPAALSKWARARMALACGADAVVELPALFAVRTADAFARGGVAILGGLGIDVLSFGSEVDDLALLQTLADIRENEPEAVSAMIRRGLGQGVSHARARGEAIRAYAALSPEVFNQPNLTLATEYVRMAKRCFPNMRVCAVRRIGGYHDDTISGIASASAIRGAAKRGDVEAALSAIPERARRYAGFDAMHPMDDLLLYRLREMSAREMAGLPDVSEGLERRLYRLSRETASREALLEALKCKRYTRARLSRLLTHALLGVTRQMTEAHPAPAYARLIGVRAEARALLTELERRSTIPIAASSRQIESDPVFRLECRATDIWSLLHDHPEQRLPGRELTEKFVRL